jgi:Dockerin type I domain
MHVGLVLLSKMRPRTEISLTMFANRVGRRRCRSVVGGFRPGLQHRPAFNWSLEALEDRLMLSSGMGTFASIHDNFPNGTAQTSVQITLFPGEFTSGKIPNRLIEIHAFSSDGEPVSISGLSTMNSRGSRPETIQTIGPGRAVARLPFGSHSLILSGPEGSGFEVDFSLFGDVNGNFTVDRSDLGSIYHAIGRREGQAGYVPALDLNKDGRIGRVDLSLARENLGSSTRLRPLNVALSIAPISDPTGQHVVDNSQVSFAGHTSPHANVELISLASDVDLQTRADGSGDYEITGTFIPGAHQVAVIATDSFRQRVTAGLDFVRTSAATGGTVVLTSSNTLTVNGAAFAIKGVDGPQQNNQLGGLCEFGQIDGCTYGCMSPYGVASVAEAGGNVIRTYGDSFQFTADSPTGQATSLQAAFDEAAAENVKVIVGLWLLPHSDTGTGYTSSSTPGVAYNTNGYLNYNDATQVAVQKQLILQMVQAVIADGNRSNTQLFWDIGNEVLEASSSGNTPAAVYGAINDIATSIKATDTGNGGTFFPCLTSIVVPTTVAIQQIATNAPKLDLIGVNAYSGFYNGTEVMDYLDGVESTFQAAAQQQGNWKGPWMITEFASYDLGGSAPSVDVGVAGGAAGQPSSNSSYLWEDSTQQASDFTRNYNMIAGWSSSGCVGSCAFTWRGPAFLSWPTTWFTSFASPTWNSDWGRFEPSDSLPTQPDAALAVVWGGTAPQSIPQIVDPSTGSSLNDPQGIGFTGTDWRSQFVSANTQYTATVSATSPDGSALTYYWSIAVGSNGTQTQMLPIGPNSFPVTSTATGSYTFTTPAATGIAQSYRVICVVASTNGTSAKVSGVFGIQASSV